MRAYRGHLIHIGGSPRLDSAREHLVSVPDGVLVVNDAGSIAYSGSYQEMPAYPDTEMHDCRPGFLLPGFIDTHIHYPQTHCIDSYGGGQLLDWLQHCIFPAEAKLADRDYARDVARDFCRRRVAVGTTTALVFGSAFPDAQDTLFEESARIGLRTISGRGIQTVGPEAAGPLLTDDDTAIALTHSEIDRWHNAEGGLVKVAVVPRFALSVTGRTLHALGELYDAVRGRGVYFHTHLSENVTEIDAVRTTYGVENYLDTYDGRFDGGGLSLLGPRSVFAHAVHCTDGELNRLSETGSSIAHCPTSQLFLGSGTMPWRRTVASGVNVALGTDVSAGDEWLIPRVLNDCFKVHISEPGGQGLSISPAALLFTATLAGARALQMEDRIGNLDVGKEADFVVIDPRCQPLLSELLTPIAPDDADRLLFTLLLSMREDAVGGVYVRGRLLSPR
ncbi:guanine deaminase [Mycolicibacterium sp. jd]|jgi:guanine deaminase|uniref:Guanine deaminase n=1 Tax=Mycolicibacterium vanbaalenii (strain DSM 7251 / JCM 13017 / BCRC 16820 / KCTC 9966 / NRRL B-24157 / PYR-1) TaxID=350058 RepID=A1TFV0_MYCVP|nr:MULTISPECIES: guanine deaminase [Mycolicibacterium]ABM16050.1 guanine deaminase [Mycolicibacterium vanbaalenii PYR-1]PQP39817.1 guanine deaminase [Mycolicibacterium austroafricanum]QZT56447.1 guanine deaminase [Mycolicibacterium austroafricanum]